MQNPARIPDIVLRERFIKRLLANGCLSFVSGDDGWACVPFRQDPSREIVLFWSSRQEAIRWSDVVATHATVHDVALPALLCDVLPMLAERRCLIGPDWSTDPGDPVIETHDLVDRIWRERTDQFLSARRQDDCVWLLESASGPAFLPSQRQVGKEFLPVWSSRDDAQANAAGSWAVKRPISVSLQVFRERYLPFLEQRGWFVGPEPMPGAGTRELSPAEFSLRVFPALTLSQLRAV
jgi:Protein of unknown function (DUF2750)